MASSPGHAGRPNEDFVAAVPGAAVLLDGAGIPGAEAVCRHGVPWYVGALGAAALDRLFHDPDVELTAALGDAIAHVAGLHAHTCDIASAISPQASVAIVRFGQGCADYLVLGDAFVVLDHVESGTHVVADPREVRVRRECMVPLEGLTAGTSEYEQVLASVRDDFRARRNQPGGFWVAKDDPHAATEAVTGSVELERLRCAALLSNGAARAVHPYRLAEWPDVMRSAAPQELLRRVREAESAATSEPSSATHAPDDATVAFCEPGPARRPALSSQPCPRLGVGRCGGWLRSSRLPSDSCWSTCHGGR